MANLYGYNSSSAYKPDYERNIITAEKLHEEKQTVTKTVTRKKTATSFASVLKAAVCFAVAFAIINGYVKINEANGELAQLEADYNDMVASNQALQMKIDRAVDLEDLQSVADSLGMVRPERGQVFYVDMEQEDFAETPEKNNEDTEQSKVKGVTGSLTGALNIFN